MVVRELACYKCDSGSAPTTQHHSFLETLSLSQASYFASKHIITIEVQQTLTKQTSFKVTSEFQFLF